MKGKAHTYFQSIKVSFFKKKKPLDCIIQLYFRPSASYCAYSDETMISNV